MPSDLPGASLAPNAAMRTIFSNICHIGEGGWKGQCQEDLIFMILASTVTVVTIFGMAMVTGAIEVRVGGRCNVHVTSAVTIIAIVTSTSFGF